MNKLINECNKLLNEARNPFKILMNMGTKELLDKKGNALGEIALTRGIWYFYVYGQGEKMGLKEVSGKTEKELMKKIMNDYNQGKLLPF